MGTRYYSTGEEWRRIKRSFSSTGTGFLRVKGEYYQSGDDGDSDWIAAWERPSASPAAPLINVSLVPKTRNRFQVSVVTPPVSESSLRRVVVKVGIGFTPNPPNVDNSGYYTENDTNVAWSEWFTEYEGDIPNQITESRKFPSVTQSRIEVPLNTDVTFSAWAEDEFGNWSLAGTKTVRTLRSTDAPAGGIAYTTVIMPMSFDEWAITQGLWQFSPTKVDNTFKYSDPAWIRDPANRAWWAHTGGAFNRMTHLWFGNSLRGVLNQAEEVTSVSIGMVRRWNDTVNMSGGVRVNDANTFGKQNGAKFRVWATTQGSRSPGAPGSTSMLIPGSDSVVNTGTFLPQQEKQFIIPEKTWSHMLDARAGSGRSLCFYNPTSTGTSTDEWSLSWAVPGTFNGVLKPAKISMSGYLTVNWVGYGDNPFPTADPSHPNFRPLGAPSNW